MKTLIRGLHPYNEKKKNLISEKLKNQQLRSIRGVRSTKQTVIRKLGGKSKYRES